MVVGLKHSVLLSRSIPRRIHAGLQGQGSRRRPFSIGQNMPTGRGAIDLDVRTGQELVPGQAPEDDLEDEWEPTPKPVSAAEIVG